MLRHAQSLTQLWGGKNNLLRDAMKLEAD